MSETQSTSSDQNQDIHAKPDQHSKVLHYSLLRWLTIIVLLAVVSSIWWWPRVTSILSSSSKKDAENHAIVAQSTEKMDTAEIKEELTVLEQRLLEKISALESKIAHQYEESGAQNDSVSKMSYKQTVFNADQEFEKDKAMTLHALFKIQNALLTGSAFKELQDYLDQQGHWIRDQKDALNVLRSVSHKGAPTLAQLKNAFEQIHTPQSNTHEIFSVSSWREKFLSMIRLEKTALKRANHMTHVEQIKFWFDQGDVEAVIQAIEDFRGAQQESYSQLLTQIKLYQHVHDSFNLILAQVIAQQEKQTQNDFNNTTNHPSALKGAAE